jgi:hypothetical protein
MSSAPDDDVGVLEFTAMADDTGFYAMVARDDGSVLVRKYCDSFEQAKQLSVRMRHHAREFVRKRSQ